MAVKSNKIPTFLVEWTRLFLLLQGIIVISNFLQSLSFSIPLNEYSYCIVLYVDFSPQTSWKFHFDVKFFLFNPRHIIMSTQEFLPTFLRSQLLMNSLILTWQIATKDKLKILNAVTYYTIQDYSMLHLYCVIWSLVLSQNMM